MSFLDEPPDGEAIRLSLGLDRRCESRDQYARLLVAPLKVDWPRYCESVIGAQLESLAQQIALLRKHVLAVRPTAATWTEEGWWDVARGWGTRAPRDVRVQNPPALEEAVLQLVRACAPLAGGGPADLASPGGGDLADPGSGLVPGGWNPGDARVLAERRVPSPGAHTPPGEVGERDQAVPVLVELACLAAATSGEHENA
ncbi:hypothetical protein T492DRAFT_875420 [Pavlovales sp. CCMP2436]|nr:hypothetical protein T492DRAFT_875420 [Pavlovales sp. CCMP2436]